MELHNLNCTTVIHLNYNLAESERFYLLVFYDITTLFCINLAKHQVNETWQHCFVSKAT